MAIKRLIENMNIVQSLVIPGLDSDMDVIQKLDDEPNDVGGLTAQQLKAEFDKAGNIVKRYINEILLPALSDTVAEAEEREKAETERKRNEILRQEAEQQRADETTGIVAQATQQANQAMESKNTAVAASKKAEQSAAEAHSDAGIVRESVSIAQKNAKQTSFDRESIKAALDNLPAGAVPVIDNLTTGGAAVALSAEQGRLLGELANLTDYPRALYNLGAAPGVNLLDNWYFVGGGGPGQLPVNQRGQTHYDVTGGCTIDRWTLTGTGGSMDVQDEGVLLTSPGQYATYFTHKIPSEIVSNLAGKQICLSALWGDDTGYGGSLNIYFDDKWSDYVEITANDLNSRVLTVPDGVKSIYVNFGSNGAGTCKIKAVKLELGSKQTLAHQESGQWVLNEIPNYGEQLARCQRYLFSAHDPIVPYACIGSGYIANDGTTAVIIIPLPVTLRTVPSIIVKGEIRIDMANGSIGFMTAKGVYNIGRGCTAIYGTVTNGTAGVPCYALLDTNDDVLLSAEL